MKLETLSKMLDAAGLCADSKSSIPILSGVLFEVADGECRLTTTDLYTTIRVEADARGVPAMRLVLPWRQTRDVVRAFAGKDADVTLEADPSEEVPLDDPSVLQRGKSKPGALRLSVGSSKRRVAASWMPSDFPDTPTVADELGYAEQLPKMVEHVKCALGMDFTRPHLCLRMERDAEGFRVVTTDGKRLAKAEVPGHRDVNELGGWNVPSDAALKLIKLFTMRGKAPLPPCIVTGKGHVGVRVQINGSVSVTMLAKEVEATFPLWRQVIPTYRDHVAEAQASTLRDRLLSMKPITADGGGVRVFIDDGLVRLDAEDGDGNTAHEEIEAETVHHPLASPAVTLGVDNRMLCEALAYAPGRCDVVTNDVLDPVRVCFADDRIEIEHIIMPMRP